MLVCTAAAADFQYREQVEKARMLHHSDLADGYGSVYIPEALSRKYRHAARDTLIPILTRMGIQMGSLITGIVFVEVVFSYPGLGALAYESIKRRDILLMDGILLISAVWIILMNLASDILLKRLDPRVGEGPAK
jgi:ABC-type antimicrobial peptide transport system permease subunit